MRLVKVSRQPLQVGDYIATCEIEGSATFRVEETDAIAMAGAEAAAYACNGSIADSETETIAKATAQALAEVFGLASIFCATRGDSNSRACALAETDVRAIAFAQVRM